MKKAYFFINGFLTKNKFEKDKDEVIDLDNQYIYQIENFGVSKNFDSCVFDAILDLVETDNEDANIIPNSYVAVFEINVTEKDYCTIDESCNLADFDILQFIKDNQEKVVYSVMFDNDGNQVENFIKLTAGKIGDR